MQLARESFGRSFCRREVCSDGKQEPQLGLLCVVPIRHRRYKKFEVRRGGAAPQEDYLVAAGPGLGRVNLSQLTNLDSWPSLD